MNIRITLDEQSINEAIKQVKLYRKDLEAKVGLLVKRLVDEGVAIAKMEVLQLGAFDKGELLSSLDGMMYSDGKSGIIFTGCDHAAYVEFGTGVVGQQSPHPTMPWQYDVNGHGQAGWHYYDEGRMRWTKGMPSRPYMYLTASALAKEMVRIAREVFK